jgi:predicted RNase H-like nuclease
VVWLCGVDGFKEKWRAVLGNFATGEVRLMDSSLSVILDLPERPAIIAIDVPIGLPGVTLPGGRICDRLARRLLGPRHRSVFSPIGRMCLQTNNREKASQLSIDRGGIGIGVQSWGLAKKLLEIDRLMTPAEQRIVREVHPEVSFCEMNGGEPLIQRKKTPDGERQRVSALKRGGFPESFLSPLRTLRSGRDDFLDACAALWTAERIYRGTTAKRIPSAGESEHDERGLDMAIWF